MIKENSSFELEHQAFEAKKEELLGLCAGKFAVFHGRDFLGVFDTPQAAYAAGIEKFGNVRFLIKLVAREERVEQVPALYFGFIHACP